MKKANEINKVVELTQDTARATVNTSVEVAKLAENSIQGLYKVGYDMNASGLNVAKGYWDALSAIRNEWINLFQQTGEKAVDSIGTLSSIEIPFQKEVSEFGGIAPTLVIDSPLRRFLAKRTVRLTHEQEVRSTVGRAKPRIGRDLSVTVV